MLTIETLKHENIQWTMAMLDHIFRTVCFSSPSRFIWNIVL